MRVIVAGSRSLQGGDAERLIYSALNLCPLEFTEVVSGAAHGVDSYGEKWAEANFYPVVRFPADWRTHGKAAGAIRNAQMAEYADALVYIRYDSTPGTQDMINKMVKKGKPTWGVTIASTTIQD